MEKGLLLWLIAAFYQSLAVEALTLDSAKNFRPIRVNGKDSYQFYRAAALDDLSNKDAEALMNVEVVVMDLRNADEIASKIKKRTEASVKFYQHVEASSSQSRLVHVPILQDVDAFWDEAIVRMDPLDRFWATMQTVTSAGALDRAAARKMEDEGLSMLYTVTLATAKRKLRTALDICASAEGPVIFHCQKGKDRTGLVAMLLQSCLGSSDEEIVKTYAESGPLLGETVASESSPDNRTSGTFIDWSRFRGSPSEAMEDTMDWIKRRYGSVEKYIETELGLGGDYVDRLRNNHQQSPSAVLG